MHFCEIIKETLQIILSVKYQNVFTCFLTFKFIINDFDNIETDVCLSFPFAKISETFKCCFCLLYQLYFLHIAINFEEKNLSILNDY